jgi:chemotaxis signal transduction protein
MSTPRDYSSPAHEQATLVEVFRRRAEKLARRLSHSANAPVGKKLLSVRAGKERFGIELRHVKQVFSSVSLTRLPGGHVELAGIAILNGSICSVFDLGRLLDLPASNRESLYVVLLKPGDTCMAISVEAVERICFLEREKLLSADHLAVPGSTCITGATEDGIAVLDADALLRRALGPVSSAPNDRFASIGSPCVDDFGTIQPAPGSGPAAT